MGLRQGGEISRPADVQSEVVNVVLTQKRNAAVALRLVSLVALMSVTLGQLTGCMMIPGSHFSSRGAEKIESDSDAASLPDSVRVMPITTAFLQTGSNDQDTSHDEVLATLQRDARSYRYLVGPGDVLNVTVWDHPELTIPAGSMRSAEESGNWVHADGSIFYPYVGKIQVAGLDVAEIRELIAKRISRYIEKPQVDVTVAAFRSQRVYITGDVAQPGMVPVTNVPLHLLDAVNKLGGLQPTADWRNVILTRDGRDYPLSLQALYQRGDLRHNVLLQHNDIVHVPSNVDSKVFVLGEVKEARPVMMDRNGLSLAGALTEAGGINELTARASGIFVMRRDVSNGEAHINVYQLHARNAAAYVLADQFVMQPRDIVYVTAAPITRWNRVIQQLLPTVQMVYFGALAEDRLRDPD